ncbi:hypothetical protein LTR53_016143 [Teratosphaeriaceae sp. CCFEE 6253]|nr:hypothetical protein LTR53_016143 [Teratosphaeriaceae sp. CCFEE 6253]
MATQPHYSGAEYDPFHRPLHRSMSTAAYYERPAPYGYYDPGPRQDLRAEYSGRPMTRTLIQEPELEIGPGGSRRRIAVAVNSTQVQLSTGVEAYPQASSAGGIAATGGYSADAGSANGCSQGHYLQSRPSLPTLHTHSSWVDSYDGYENSPADAYTYASASIPRQDSFASVENYRSWSTSAPLSAPVTGSYYNEPQAAYSFGSLQAPSYTTAASARLPSVTTDSFSLGSLHASLPAQTAHERRLPVPYTIQYPTTAFPPPHPTSQIPQVKPLNTSYNEPRAPRHGIYSQTAMPWSLDSMPSSTRTASSASSYAPMPPHAQPPQTHRHASAAPSAPAVLGYEFPPRTSSPEISPTSGPIYSETFPGTACGSNSLGIMAPPTFSRHPSAIPNLQPGAAREPVTTSSASHDAAATTASLYSFSTDNIAELPAASDGSVSASIGTPSAVGSSGQTYLPPLRPAQSQHHEIDGGVRRQASFDQQRVATAHRMSVSNLSRPY